MRRRFNTARIRQHATYDVQDICSLFGVHKNTVREWLRQGLPKTEDRRPYLIYGTDLKTFLDARQKSRRRKCAPDQLYCCRCRLPRRTMGNLVDLEPRNEKTVMLKGFCESCETLVHKVQSVKSLPKILKIFDIPREQRERLAGCLSPSLSCDLGKETRI